MTYSYSAFSTAHSDSEIIAQFSEIGGPCRLFACSRTESAMLSPFKSLSFGCLIRSAAASAAAKSHTYFQQHASVFSRVCRGGCDDLAANIGRQLWQRHRARRSSPCWKKVRWRRRAVLRGMCSRHREGGGGVNISVPARAPREHTGYPDTANLLAPLHHGQRPATSRPSRAAAPLLVEPSQPGWSCIP